MRSIKLLLLIGLSLVLVATGCVTSNETTPTEPIAPQSVDQETLDEFNDDFTSFRDDLWTKFSGITRSKKQSKNLEPINPIVKDGKVVFKSKTGNFSKGSLNSTFEIEGDFDLQINCEINFLQGITGMEQITIVGIYDKGMDVLAINLVKIESKKGAMYSARFETNKNRRYSTSSKKAIESFSGSLRLKRTGKTVYALLKPKGSGNWEQIGKHSYKTSPVGFGFSIQNFGRNRQSVKAEHSFEATYSEFRINAADNIIEGDI